MSHISVNHVRNPSATFIKKSKTLECLVLESYLEQINWNSEEKFENNKENDIEKRQIFEKQYYYSLELVL
jgi:hypothetical protein